MNAQQLRIYAIADIHSPDCFRMAQLSADSYDLVLTLGDIDEDTLDYIACMTHGIPLLGVLGNHDPEKGVAFESLHARSIAFRGLRLGGCGGGPRYKKDTPNHYTERQVSKFLRKMPAVDLFISHAPPPSAALNGGLVAPTDFIHRGFDAFDAYLHTARPRFWLHGHLSRRYCCTIDGTKVMGICGAQPLILDFPAAQQTVEKPANATLLSIFGRSQGAKRGRSRNATHNIGLGKREPIIGATRGARA